MHGHHLSVREAIRGAIHRPLFLRRVSGVLPVNSFCYATRALAHAHTCMFVCSIHFHLTLSVYSKNGGEVHVKRYMAALNLRLEFEAYSSRLSSGTYGDTFCPGYLPL